MCTGLAFVDVSPLRHYRRAVLVPLRTALTPIVEMESGLGFGYSSKRSHCNLSGRGGVVKGPTCYLVPGIYVHTGINSTCVPGTNTSYNINTPRSFFARPVGLLLTTSISWIPWREATMFMHACFLFFGAWCMVCPGGYRQRREDKCSHCWAFGRVPVGSTIRSRTMSCHAATCHVRYHTSQATSREMPSRIPRDPI